MNIVLVGAGAVGQVYGRHLAAGGAKVAFYVKPTHREELRQAQVMYPLNGKKGLVRFGGYDVLSSPEELRARKVDQLWLCVAAHATKGAWVEELAAAAPTAQIVSLQPGLEDRANLEQRFGAERIISGLITMIAWQAPLPNEQLHPPGIMYWLPPLAPNLFDGPEGPVRDLVKTLRRGGCPARRRHQLGIFSSQGEAWLQPMVMALEAAGWSWKQLAAGPLLDLGARAAQESLAVAAAYHHTKPGLIRFLARRGIMRLVLKLAPKLVPFDIETYFAYHFKKVGEQTRLLLRGTLQQAEQRGLPHAALDDLQQRLSA